jgi:hypothetical protein
VARDDLIYVAQAPPGFSARRIVGTALALWAGLGVLAPQGWSAGLRLAFAAAAVGAAVAQTYGRRCVLTREALYLVGPLGRRVVPLDQIRGLYLGRRGPLTSSLYSTLRDGNLFLPAHWSGLALSLADGSELFVPAADPRQLARRILELRPEACSDDLSENDYFAFLERSRPETWPRLTRSCIRSGSGRSIGSTPSRSALSRG